MKEKQFTGLTEKGHEQKISRKVFQICKRVLKLPHNNINEKIKGRVVHILNRKKVKPLMIYPSPSLWGNRPLHMSINVYYLSAGLLDNVCQNIKYIYFLSNDSTI